MSTDVERVAAAARVITDHYPMAHRTLCRCGKEWHPRHVAEKLLVAGCLAERVEVPL